MMEDVTVFVCTKDEELNIKKCLDSLVPFFRNIIVLDSGSRDKTLEYIAEYEGVRVEQFKYSGGYPKKRQWALDTLDFDTEWVMMVDADECMTPELYQEIKENKESGHYHGLFINKVFHFLGKKFKYGGFTFYAMVFFRKDSGRFEELANDLTSTYDMEIHERVLIQGETKYLKNGLIHDDFKSLERYLARHNVYSTWESDIRQNIHGGSSSLKPSLFGDVQQRRRFLKTISMKLPFEGFVWFFYHYVFRLGFLEGRRGLIASQIKANYVDQVHWKNYERKILAEMKKNQQ